MTQQTGTGARSGAGAASAGRVGDRPRGRADRRGLLTAAGLGLCLGLLALGPGLMPGYLLSYDMVFVPSPAFNSAVLGTAGTLPRAVPSDAVIAALARLAPADAVQKVVLLAIFVLACAGAARLLRKERLAAQLVAGLCYAWNPFVAERLILGQWATLLGYAGLPWVLSALAPPAASLGRRTVRLAIAVLPAAVGGFAAMLISALVAIPASLARPGPDRPPGPGADGAVRAAAGPPAPGPSPAASPAADSVAAGDAAAGRAAGGGVAAGSVAAGSAAAGGPASAPRRLRLWPGRSRLTGLLAAAGVLAAASLPWLIPALTRTVTTSPAGVALFAARADTPFGTFGSLLLLGGGWNAQTVPAGFGGWLALASMGLAAIALGGFAALGRRRWPGLGIAAVAGLVLAMLGAVGPGQDLLRALLGWWPGFAVLRDGQQFIAPLALAEALGLGLVVGRVLTAARPPVLRETRTIVAATLAIVPLILLPGLAWGAAGRLRPVEYPASWVRARQLINADPRPGKALLLPWAAYRRFGWNHDEAVLDPWPRLLDRTVTWNDGVQVGRVQIPPEDPGAAAIDPVLRSSAPLTGMLRSRGYRYVIVDAGFGPGPAGRYPFRARLTGLQLVYSGPGLMVYRLPR